MAPPLPLLAGVLLAATISVSLAAASAATVEFPKEALPTSSGYLPVDSPTNASLFYAYYEANHPLTTPADTPLLLWLQGGPGCSGLVGNFIELGPYLVAPDAASLSHNPSPGTAASGSSSSTARSAPASARRRPPPPSRGSRPPSPRTSSPRSRRSLTPARPPSTHAPSSSPARATPASTSRPPGRTSSPRTRACRRGGGSTYAAPPSATG